MSNVVAMSRSISAETILWRERVRTAGGGFEWNSVAIADRLVKVLKSKSYYDKIRYMLPLLGTGIDAARVPLVDKIGGGAATNNSFVNADFSQRTGLQGNGTTKYFNFGVTGATLGIAGSGGLGYWALAVGANGWSIGERNADLYGLYVDNATTGEIFYWGLGSNISTAPTVGSASDYYAQRTPSTLTLYRSGISISSLSTSTNTSTINTSNLCFMAIDASFLSNGTSGLGYFTDGTMTAPEIYDLHLALAANLMGPTGRI